MSLMHDCAPFVFAATNMALATLPLLVAVSHTGCPARKIGASSAYPIADRAALSFLSLVGSPDTTLRITSRATSLSDCHMQSHHLETFCTIRGKSISIKGYLASTVQQLYQPQPVRFCEFRVRVLDTLLDIIAHSKKIMCLNNASGLLQPYAPEPCRAV